MDRAPRSPYRGIHYARVSPLLTLYLTPCINKGLIAAARLHLAHLPISSGLLVDRWGRAFVTDVESVSTIGVTDQ
ncbi:hypothetical protein J6590_016797 [Homalodisca vitripennis]|nr:hypothetical protein J6590_016797 [Homalodisca vitripennis]